MSWVLLIEVGTRIVETEEVLTSSMVACFSGEAREEREGREGRLYRLWIYKSSTTK